MRRAALARTAALGALAAGLALLGLEARAQPSVPALTGRVVDTADILSPYVEDELVERLAAYEAATSAQVAVLTIPSLQGAVLEEYATTVFRTWGLGRADADDGVLLLVARDDRELRIEVGYGLEGSLTDARAGRIIRNEIVPRFKQGDFDGGVLQGVEAILGTIEGTYTEPRGASGITINGRPGHLTPLWERLVFGLLFGGIPFLMVIASTVYSGEVGAKGAKQAGCMTAFVSPFIGGAFLVVTLSGWMFLAGILAAPLFALLLSYLIEWHPTWGPARRERRRKAKIFHEARQAGKTSVMIDGVRHAVPVASSSSSSSGGFSSSSGGGFSGGGGSSGGGGASGSW